jgi:hypothetical protein
MLLTATSTAAAQDELHLRRAFEGKRVTVLLDMPATSEGVDLFPGTGRPLDFQKYSARIKKYGTAIKEGEKSIITKIKVKNDLVEVHLGGGGYGTFGDVFNSALTTNGADSGAAQQMKVQNERTQRAAAGSRFNIRFPNGITPEDLEPDAILKSLTEYATVGAPIGKSAAVKAETAEVPTPAKEPAAAARRKTNGPVTTASYASPKGPMDVDYYNGVAVEVRAGQPAAARANHDQEGDDARGRRTARGQGHQLEGGGSDHDQQIQVAGRHPPRPPGGFLVRFDFVV